MKQTFFILLILPLAIAAQNITSLSLQKAYDLAQQHYPMIKQRDLLKQTSGLSIENLSRGFLPQLSISGQATYQSDVTQFNIPITGVTVAPLSKDQYRMVADVNQLLYDGGITREQKNLQQLNEDAEQQKLEVELYKVKERINQLYLGVLFTDEQLKQVALVKDDINTGIKKTEAMVNNGVAFRSNLNMLKAELLKTEQHAIELKASRKGLLDVMSLFIGENLDENCVLEKPQVPGLLNNDIQRPELKLFSAQEKFMAGQEKLIDARNKPRASVFVQGGYGRPGLNLLDNSFNLFYIGGLRFNWSFGGLYTQKREKQLAALNQKGVEIQKETFLLNTNTALKQQQAELDKLNQLISKDAEIIDLRIKVKEAAKAQLENGVITASDYLREVNAEDQSRQSLITHQLQLLQAQINYQTISGK
jgi:outer membrane protein TolC